MSFKRKTRKLIKNPKLFFKDSKYFITRKRNSLVNTTVSAISRIKILDAKQINSTRLLINNSTASESRNQLQCLWDTSPWNGNVVLLWCQYFAKINQHKEGIRLLDVAINRAPNWNLYYERSKMRRSLGDLREEIVSDIEIALNLKPFEHQLHRYYVGLIWSIRGLSPKLISICQAMENQGNKNTAADWLKIAAIYDEAGRYNIACKLFGKALLKDSLILNRVQYLPLLATMYRMNISEEKICILSKQYSDYIGSKRGEFEKCILLNRNSFCVVGNGPSELGSQKGNIIDKYKIVIRFNAFDTTYPNSVDYGVRTTHWVRAGNFVELHRKCARDFKSIIISGYNSLHRNTMGLDLVHDAYIDQTPLEFIPPYIYEQLFEKLNATPSAGIAILYWIYRINGPIPKSRIFGFSFGNQKKNKSDHYFKNNKKSDFYVHDWGKEAEVLSEIIAADSGKRTSHAC